MDVNLIINILPEIATFLTAVAFIIMATKFVPLIKSSFNRDQIKVIRDWAEFLVESAERLEMSDKLNNVTKKEYVMNKLMELVSENGYEFTEEQLDDIRRAAVIVYENTYKMIEFTVDELLEGVDLK